MKDRLKLIYEQFQSISTTQGRIDFLIQLREQNLPFDINYERLIEIWSTQY